MMPTRSKEKIAAGLGLVGVDLGAGGSAVVTDKSPQFDIEGRPAHFRADYKSPSIKTQKFKKRISIPEANEVQADFEAHLAAAKDSPSPSSRLVNSGSLASLRGSGKMASRNSLPRSPLITNIIEEESKAKDDQKLKAAKYIKGMRRKPDPIYDDPDAQGKVNVEKLLDKVLDGAYRANSDFFFNEEIARSASMSKISPSLRGSPQFRSTTSPLIKSPPYAPYINLATKPILTNSTPNSGNSDGNGNGTVSPPSPEQGKDENLVPAPLSIRRNATSSPLIGGDTTTHKLGLTRSKTVPAAVQQGKISNDNLIPTPLSIRRDPTSLSSSRNTTPKLGMTPSGTVPILQQQCFAIRVDSGVGLDDDKSGPEGGETSKSKPQASGAPLFSYGNRILLVPDGEGPRIKKRSHKASASLELLRDNKIYFNAEERDAIHELVYSEKTEFSCAKHTHCTDCLNQEFAFQESKALPISMAPTERQTIIANNRSLRTIKNELENLMSNGAISDDAYDTIMRTLPDESSFNGRNGPSPSPVPTAAFNNLRVSSSEPPPAYNNSPSGPPTLPNRTPSIPPPTRPVVGRAIALYNYNDNESNGMSFAPYDPLIVYSFSNAEWWEGRNEKTGATGVFPVNHVQLEQAVNKLPATPNEHHAPIFPPNEKQNYGEYGGHYAPPQQQQYQPGPPPPGPSNPYNSAVPPMAVAEQPTDHKPSKGSEMGKKFGKKLGNAAIFGAGATIGGNIVNSIF